MPAAPKYRELWTIEEEMVPYPRALFLDMGIPPERLPDGDEIPLDVGIVYTAMLEDEIGLYQELRLVEPGGGTRTLIVVGAVETNPALLYALCTRTWTIVQFDLEEHDIQYVNADLRAFVEFLFHFGLFIEDDDGLETRAGRAVDLRTRLTAIDPSAFAEDSWWSLTFSVMLD